MTSEVLRASGETNGGALWLQRQAGKAPVYLGCTDLEDLASPQGDVTLSICRDARGKFITVGRGRGMPGAPTTSFTTWIYPEHSILDDIVDANCPVYLYALSRNCDRADLFNNYVRGRILTNAIMTTITDINLVKNTETGEQAMKFDVSADFPVARVRAVKVVRQDIAETTDLTDISFCDEPQCEGACGGQHDAGQDGFIGSEAPAGSPTANADIWNTEDGGSTWMNATPGASHPFGDGLDIISVACFQQDKGVRRWIAARETKGGTVAEIAYSDDGGVTWTQVLVGSVVGECASHSGALFAIDKYHVWFATDKGNVYFSSDGGVTWVLQDSVTASGANILKSIHFADFSNGYAVGASGTIIQTVDGGDTWAAIVDPSGGDDFYSVHVFSQFRMLCGNDAGELWQTWDEGDNFTAEAYTGQANTDKVADMRFVNDVVGYMIVDTAAPIGKVHRTINGGYDWQLLNYVTNTGLNALAVISENLAFAVGNAQGGTGVVLKISG